MESLSALWIILGVATLIFGPAGGVWAGMKGSVRRIEERFTDYIEQAKADHEDTRVWLKSLQTKTDKNETDIAVLKDRAER